jgi:hypothetical protein
MYPACGARAKIATMPISATTGGKVLLVMVVTSIYPTAPLNNPVPPMIVPG